MKLLVVDGRSDAHAAEVHLHAKGAVEPLVADRFRGIGDGADAAARFDEVCETGRCGQPADGR